MDQVLVGEEQFKKDLYHSFEKSSVDVLTEFGIQYLHQAIGLYKQENFDKSYLKKCLEEISSNPLKGRIYNKMLDWFIEYCEKVHKEHSKQTKNKGEKNFLFNKSIQAISKQQENVIKPAPSKQIPPITTITPPLVKQTDNSDKTLINEKQIKIVKENKVIGQSNLKIIQNSTVNIEKPKQQKENLEIEIQKPPTKKVKKSEQSSSSDEEQQQQSQALLQQQQQMQMLLTFMTAAAVIPKLTQQYQQPKVNQMHLSERCRYFPNCTNPNCQYVHPSTICRYFPNCKRGVSCIYLHKQCKHGIHCKNLNCIYEHPKGRSVPTQPPKVLNKQK